MNGRAVYGERFLLPSSGVLVHISLIVCFKLVVLLFILLGTSFYVSAQVLYVPRHWWHYVESVDPITVSVNSWIELVSDPKP